VRPCPHGDPGQVPAQPPKPAPPAPQDPGAPPVPADPLARLPEVLTAREAAAILRVGRNQLYQAVARGELAAVRIGRSIRIPKHALLDLLAAAQPTTASGDE
jgi:excisionase family DNA binding protein